MEQLSEGPPPYIYIDRNEFAYRKHKKQKEEDIAICVCKYEANNADSACGERCLNVLTSTECTPDFCPCGIYCKNQRFQKCEYPMFKLFKTEGRGWGLRADENIQAGQFVIEYCGEVISWKEAKRRSQAYEAEGMRDAFIISLNGTESIDATKKGSLARFINHSCQPNCETRKWTVLGEIRVGIFAKQDIPAATELAYDYNFEWYGGAIVRCLCGASCCSEFLGAKSRGFQEATYLWEDDDDRYSVENVPLYDSEEDEPTSKLLKLCDTSNITSPVGSENDSSMRSNDVTEPEGFPRTMPIAAEPLNSVPMEEEAPLDAVKVEVDDKSLSSHDTQQKFPHKNAMISRIRSNSACRNYHIEPSPLFKTPSQYFGGRSKTLAQKQVNVKLIGKRLASQEAREELLSFEESKNQAASQLDSVYDEIRPTIEEFERDSQDSVSTSVAEKWILASCNKLRAEFDLHSSVIRHISCTPRRRREDVEPQGEDNGIGMKYLEMGK